MRGSATGVGAWVAGWDPLVVVGAVALGIAIGLTILFPPSLLSAALGVVAVAGLAREPRLGVLPAALLALLAVPYGRAAENGLASIAGVPLRFHDGAVLAALVLALPMLRRLDLRSLVARAVLAWLAVGVVAIAIGVVEGQGARDILRDARWWFLYGFVLLALAGGVRRPQILRAVLLGSTIFGLAILATAVLPAFDGALKERAMAYDWGLLRLQFSNSIFLVVAIAWVVDALLRKPRWLHAALFVLLAGTILISLTRMSIFGMAGVVGLSLLVAIATGAANGEVITAVRRSAVVVALLGLSGAIALGTFTFATMTPERATPGQPAPRTEAPLDRIFFQGPSSSVAAIERGRIATYRAAVAVIGERPITGHGLGTLVAFNYVPGGGRPATPGMQPNVDNAYLTVAMKAGLVGALVFALLVAVPLLEILRRRSDGSIRWFAIAWLGVLALTMTQSFATTGYGPFGLALLIAYVALHPQRGAMRPATADPAHAGR
jgi:O-antigen ligase